MKHKQKNPLPTMSSCPPARSFLLGHILGWYRGGRQRRAIAMPPSILTFPRTCQNFFMEEQLRVPQFLPNKTVLLYSTSLHTKATLRQGDAGECGHLLCSVISFSELSSPVTCLGHLPGPFPSSKLTQSQSHNYLLLSLSGMTHMAYIPVRALVVPPGDPGVHLAMLVSQHDQMRAQE